MNSVDLPHGVPSPVKTHVHPYPTRFHGGIWTRPVFGFPWVQRPHFVIRPSELNGMGRIDPTFRPYHGVGQDPANDWDTGQGVFRRPGYDGGGVFNPVTAGMGQANDWDTGTGVFRRPRYDGGGVFNDVSGTGLGSVPADIGKFIGAAALGFGVVALLMRR